MQLLSSGCSGCSGLFSPGVAVVGEQQGRYLGSGRSRRLGSR